MKSILVTGASRGIGRAICNTFAKKEYHIIFTTRSKDKIKPLEDEFKSSGAADAKGFILDITNADDISSLADFIQSEYTTIDVLVNNAGIGLFKSVLDIEQKEWDRLIATNLNGLFYLTKALLPPMVKAKKGYIINIGSLASRNTFAGGSSYCASKFALLGFTECLMLDLRQYNIKVSIIMPGSVNTGFSGTLLEEAKNSFKLSSSDVAEAVYSVVNTKGNNLISRIELRPAIPKAK